MPTITNDLLYRALMRRADRERDQLLKACRHNARLNARFQSLNDELDRLANAPLRRLDAQGEIDATGEVVAPAGKEDENGLG